MTENIGYRLRRAREARGLTVDEAADRMRIRKEYLTALEQGQFDVLPSPFYIRSYLRSYARFLGLDASEVLQEYQEQTMGQQNPERMHPRGRDRGARRTPERAEDGYRQWSPPEREDRESYLTRRSMARDQKREIPPHEPERSDAISRRSSAYTNGQPQFGWKDVSREEPQGAKSSSSDPDAYRPAPSPSATPPRSISMPKDVPPPSEIGLPARSDESGGGRALPVLLNEKGEQDDYVPQLSRRRKAASRKAASKKKKGTFGKWYNLFLIVGTILLIPAALAVGILVWGDEKPPINAGDNAEVSADSNSESSKKEPVIYAAETSKSGPDHFELTQAEKIELKIEADGECWIQVREQEVGKKLEEVTLKSGDPPFTYETDKEDLWIEIKPSKGVKISVNGKHIGEYKKQKVIHIRLVK